MQKKQPITCLKTLPLAALILGMLFAGCSASQPAPPEPTTQASSSPAQAQVEPSLPTGAQLPASPRPSPTGTAAPSSPIATAARTPPPSDTLTPTAASTSTGTPELPLPTSTDQPEGWLPISPHTTSRLVQTLVLSQGTIKDFKLHEDGRLQVLTGVGYFTYQEMGAITEESIAIDEPFSKAVFSADGSKLLLVEQGHIQVMDTHGFHPLGELDLSKNGWIYGFAISADGELIAAGDVFGEISLFRSEDLTRLAVTQRQSDSLDDLVFSPDGKLLVSVTQDEGRVSVFDAASGDLLFNPSSGADVIDGVLFSPKGSLIYGCSVSGTIYVWSAENGHPVRKYTIAGSNPAAKFSLSPDGKQLLYAGSDRRLRLVGTGDGGLLQAIQFDGSFIEQIAFTPDGSQFLAYARTGQLYRWEIGNPEPEVVLDGFWYPTDFSTNDETLVAITSAGLMHWDWPDLASHPPLEAPSFEAIRSVAINREGNRTALGMNSGDIFLLDEQFELTSAAPLDSHSMAIEHIIISSDGSRLGASVFSLGNGSRLLSDQGELLLEQPEGPAFFSHPAFSGDGRYLALYPRANTVEVVDARDGSPVNTFSVQDGYLRFEGLALSSDGSRVIGVSDSEEIFVWERDSGLLLQRGSLPSAAPVTAVAINAGDSLLAIGDVDGLVTLWDLESGKDPVIFQAHNSGITELAFSGNDTRLVTQGTDGVIRIWSARP